MEKRAAARGFMLMKNRALGKSHGAKGAPIAEGVRALVNLYPLVRAGLANNTLNQSEVARQFSRELSLSKSNFHAVLSAIKREAAAGLESPAFEIDAKKVVAQSTISLKTDVAVVRFFPGSPVEKIRKTVRSIHLVQSASAASFIVDERDAGGFIEKNMENFLGATRDLSEITIVSPKQIESTPGVLLSFLSPLYSNGINIEEVLSSHTDTLLLVSSADTSRAFALLSQIIKDARKAKTN